MTNTTELKEIAELIFESTFLKLGYRIRHVDGWVFDKIDKGYRANRIVTIVDETFFSKEMTFEVNIQVSLDGQKL